MEFLFKRLQFILQFCKNEKEYVDAIPIMENMVNEANEFLLKQHEKRLAEYNYYFDELIEDDPKADLFLKEKIGIAGTTKKRRSKILKEIVKKDRIDNDDEYRLVMWEIDRKSNDLLVEALNRLLSEYEKSK